ncbi:helix-turn-helix transcriptional regulator [Massilia sp. METH4]|uniref:helix-turn-helix transcriptional regulator n=1 Tax=Massilia sp. METH4 TaxID=3123041 RepID=UPI0030CC6172
MNDFAASDLLRPPGTVARPADRAFRFGPHLHVVLATYSGVEEDVALAARQEPVLLWIASGGATASLGLVEDPSRRLDLQQGDIWLAGTPRAIRLSLSSCDAPPLKTMCIHVGLPMLAGAAREIHRKPLAGFALRDAAGRPDDTLSSLLEVLYTALKRPVRPCAHFVEGIAQAVVAHLVRRYPGTGRDPAMVQGLPPHKLQRALRTMRGTLEEPFNLEQLARQAELSVFHFSRSFKAATGLSPSRYFVQLRIEEAKRLLCETADPVIDVALLLGYRSPSHFAQVFKELTGVSPTAYRAGAMGHHRWPTGHGARDLSRYDGAFL